MSNKTTHLEMIQGVITRMGNNSFSMKGWTIGVMVAIYAFAGSDTKGALIVTLVPMAVLAVLDANYLMLERKYRALYDDVRKAKEQDIDFSMNPQKVQISLKDASKFDILKVIFSWSILPFYLACTGVTLFLYVFN